MIRAELMPPKPTELFIFVNGEFLPNSQAKISVLDHGLMYGDGCFDAWCGKNGFIFQLDAHLDRLYRSVHGLKLDLRMPKDEMRQNIIDGWTIGTGKPGPITQKFQQIYLGWLETGHHGTQFFPEAWQ